MGDPSVNNYSSANNIRIKLLLYIDKEIHKKTNKNQFYKINKPEVFKSNGFDFNFEESYHLNESVIQFNKKKFNNVHTDEIKEISSTSTDGLTPPIKINLPKRKLSNRFITKGISNYIHHQKRTFVSNNTKNGNILKLKSNNITYKGEKYSIKMKKQLSSVVMIYKKHKNDKKFLKKLCESFKMSKNRKNKFNSDKYFAFKSKDILKKKYLNKTQNETDENGTLTRKNVDIINRRKSKIFELFREKNINKIHPNKVSLFRMKSIS